MQAALMAAAPRGGGRGWQAGGYITQTPVGPGPATPFSTATSPFIQQTPVGGMTPPGPATPFMQPTPIDTGLAGARGLRRTPTTRQSQMQAYQTGAAPLGGGRGWYAGGAVDVVEDLMAERDRLQQQLQMADEVTAREIMAQIMEINKELEMAAATGMAGGGIASLMGI